ncbi:MAG: permease [Spirochaetota bacterium]|nr:permease [Spirochaetota bacterium]
MDILESEVTLNYKRNAIKIILVFSFLFVVVDYIYKTVKDITYLDRSKCLVYQLLPKTGFLFFEYFIELTIVVFIGIYIAALLEKYFMRYRRFFPSNPVTAFFYASVLPVCACSAIPLVKTMEGKMNLKTLIPFSVAAPLLNPYIIILSFNVLGMEYALLRIGSSFILALSAGYVLELLKKKDTVAARSLNICNAKACMVMEEDIYIKTYSIFKTIIPYLVIGGSVGIVLDLASSKTMHLTSLISNSFLGNVSIIIFGIPFYLCNGTDVLLLKPLLCSGINIGTGIAFSLTSTSICITSIFMLLKFIGKRLTFLLIGNIIVVTLVLSQIINLYFG